MKYIYEYHKLADEVMTHLNELKTKFMGKDLEMEKIGYLQQCIDKYQDKYIQGEEGEDKTKDFILALHNLMTDPASRELMYRFEPCEEEDLGVSFRYKNEPATSLVGGRECFKIIFIPSNIDVGRCLVLYKPGEARIEYAEIASDFSGQVYLSKAINECVIGQYGFKTKIFYPEYFMGKPFPKEKKRF